MTDKELLELAAKAAGVTLIRWNTMFAAFETRQGLWNPLYNDGDALRLAVKLKLDINCWSQSKEVGACRFEGGIKFRFTERTDDDPYAATRRAIVRTAAEIGRSMK